MKSSSSSSIGRWRTPTYGVHEDDWEAMFHPHYSIDSPRHKRPARRRDGRPVLPLLLPTTATSEAPSLPRIGNLAHPNDDDDKLLPRQQQQKSNTSSSSLTNDSQHHHHQHDPAWAHRMDVLRTIREGNNSSSSSDGRHLEPYSSPSLHYSSLQQKGFLAEFWERLKQDAKQERPPSTSNNEDDNDEEEETTGPSEKTTRKKQKRKAPFRLSFLLFAFGFLLPPLWVVGALYVPQHKDGTRQRQRHRQSPESEAVDLQWRQRSRNAFFIFITTMLVLLILTIVLRPASIGWRVSAQLPEGIVRY